MQYNGGYSTTTMNNPFRYRGYYYDSELDVIEDLDDFIEKYYVLE